MISPAGPGAVCVVCEGVIPPESGAQCSRCGGDFHFVLVIDAVGRDCGDVWLDEEYLALQFGCHRCLQPDPPGPGADPGLQADGERPPFAADRPAPADPRSRRARSHYRGVRARDLVRRPFRQTRKGG